MSNATHTLDAAERYCAERGLSLTPVRRRVLELLVDAGGPVKAYDLMAALKPGGSAQPPTVYRALNFLTRSGLAHKVEALNAYTACLCDYSHDKSGHDTVQLFICECCDTINERHIHKSPTDAPEGFRVSRSVIEYYGRCARCVAC